jgi:hypothetical protein
MPSRSSVAERHAKGLMTDTSELRTLFHRLNNQLGIILAHAELLESKAVDPRDRTRAAQVVASTLEALGTSKELHRLTLPSVDTP